MSMIPQHFPNDPELHASAKRFMFICMRSYVNAHRLRFKEYIEGKKDIVSEGELPRNVMLEFFECCNALSMYSNGKAVQLMILIYIFYCVDL